MTIAEMTDVPYTGMTPAQLMVAYKGWRRAAKKRASDLSLDLDTYPLYVDARYEPPYLARRAAKYKVFSGKNPALAGKYWSAFHKKYLKDKKDEKEKKKRSRPRQGYLKSLRQRRCHPKPGSRSRAQEYLPRTRKPMRL